MPPAKKSTPKKANKPEPKQSSPASAWFQSGFEGATNEAKRQEQARKDAENAVRRFWMPPDKEVVVIFVDGEPLNIREHQFYEAGSRPRFKTCQLGAYSKCEFCETGNKNSFTSFLSIINTSSWTNKQNQEVKNVLELWAAKATPANALRRVAEKNGGLAGCVVEIYRSPGDKTPASGDQFTVVERLKVKKIKSPITGETIEVLDPTDPRLSKKYGVTNIYGEKKNQPPAPIDYMKVLRPATPEEALIWLGGTGGAGAHEDDTISY